MANEDVDELLDLADSWKRGVRSGGRSTGKLIDQLAAALREAREDTKRLDFAVSHGWLSVPFQEHGIRYSRSSGTRVDIDAAMKTTGEEQSK